jgi:N-acetylglucosaminyldiphosphoundecaprenol N-acetyl-beta-D-mannosaminyltransferase
MLIIKRGVPLNSISQVVVKMNVEVTNIDNALNKINELARFNAGSYVCVSNIHMCMEVFDSPEFELVVNSADLVIPDGRPLSWAQKLLGHSEAEQVRGQDIMNSICQQSGTKNLNVGLYGGSSDDLLQQVITELKSSYPDIIIPFSYSPPFRPLTDEEDQDIIQQINEADVNVLLVGIGCPKQERWMAEHKDQLNCVMLGVGAAYDFIAGSKKHAPRWMQRVGLEWLFRLCSEPQRLWKRYLQQNPRFIYYFTKQLINHKFGRNKITKGNENV